MAYRVPECKCAIEIDCHMLTVTTVTFRRHIKSTENFFFRLIIQSVHELYNNNQMVYGNARARPSVPSCDEFVQASHLRTLDLMTYAM